MSDNNFDVQGLHVEQGRHEAVFFLAPLHMNSYPVIVVAVILASMAARALAHPVSHTDAWIDIGESVDVRLIVFLDDVLRHQNLLSDRTVFDADTIRMAISRHSELLSDQLRIFDQDGVLLHNQVIRGPDWEPRGDTVDLAIEASQRLTWKLRFAATRQLTVMTVLHSFTHRDLNQPGELRLHVRDRSSQKRIDATIAPGHPHSVILSGLRTNSIPQSDVNQAVCFLTVARPAVVVEFAAPLLSLSTVMGNAKSLADDTFPSGSISASLQKELTETMRNGFLKETQITINSENVHAEQIQVQFLPADSSEAYGNSIVPWTGTRLGIRCVFPRQTQAKSVRIAWRENPGRFNAVTMHVSAMGQAITTSVDLNSATADSGQLSGSQQIAPPNYEWNQSSNDTAAHVSDFVAQPVSQSVRFPGRRAMVIVMISAAMILFCLTAERPAPGVRWTSAMTCGVAGLVALIQFPDQRTEVNQAECRKLIQHILSQVYSSVLEADEFAAVDQLGRVLQPDLLEDVYVSASATLFDPQVVAPVVRVSDVRLNNLHGSLSEDSTTIVATCDWTVRGIVHHWGHAHRRDLQMSGILHLSQADDKWKLSGMEVSEAPQFHEPASNTVLASVVPSDRRRSLD